MGVYAKSNVRRLSLDILCVGLEGLARRERLDFELERNLFVPADENHEADPRCCQIRPTDFVGFFGSRGVYLHDLEGGPELEGKMSQSFAAGRPGLWVRIEALAVSGRGRFRLRLVLELVAN